MYETFDNYAISPSRGEATGRGQNNHHCITAVASSQRRKTDASAQFGDGCKMCMQQWYLRPPATSFQRGALILIRGLFFLIRGPGEGSRRQTFREPFVDQTSQRILWSLGQPPLPALDKPSFPLVFLLSTGFLSCVTSNRLSDVRFTLLPPFFFSFFLRGDLLSCRREIEERVDHFASGLEQEGLTPPNPDGMKLLALYSRNRPEWIIAEQVRQGQGGGCEVWAAKTTDYLCGGTNTFCVSASPGPQLPALALTPQNNKGSRLNICGEKIMLGSFPLRIGYAHLWSSTGVEVSLMYLA